MMRGLICAALLIAAAAVGATPLQGQVPEQCVTVPDSVAGPTPGQIRERLALRDTLAAIARRNGAAEPRALLLIDVDSTRRGKVLFIDSNLPERAVRAGTARVAEYLSALRVGRRYQALLRVDGDYLYVARGRRHCAPILASEQQRLDLLRAVEAGHPERNTLPAAVTRRLLLRLVVNGEGTVSYVDVAQPSGDAHIDGVVPGMAAQLRFRAALLDGRPFDATLRLPLSFTLR